MPRFAANLTMMFNEVPFLDRFAAAAKAGFKGVEILFPYDFPSDIMAEQLHRHGLQQVLFNSPAGNWQAGERGLACLPGREAEFEDNLETVLSYANALNCKQIRQACHHGDVRHIKQKKPISIIYAKPRVFATAMA